MEAHHSVSKNSGEQGPGRSWCFDDVLTQLQSVECDPIRLDGNNKCLSAHTHGARYPDSL